MVNNPVKKSQAYVDIQHFGNYEIQKCQKKRCNAVESP